MTTTATSTSVDHLIDAIRDGAGGTVAHLYTDDAVLDATVPGWRFHLRGGEAIAAQFSQWFRDEGRFEELDRQPTPVGEVLTYLLAWEEDGVPHAARHCHVLTLDRAGRILTDRFFCGGRWNATALAMMAEADDAD